MNERKVIVDILDDVIYHHAYASLCLKKLGDEGNIAFITEVVYGCLRNYFLLKLQYEPYIKKIKKRPEIIVLMSVYQHYFLDSVPDYAIVNEACKLVKKEERAFINALLRNVFQRELNYPSGLEINDLAIAYSFPKWLIRLWEKQYGFVTMQKILIESQKESRVYGRINHFLCSKEELKDFIFYEDDCVSCQNNLLKTKAFRDHKILVQDRQAQKIVPHLELQKGMKVLDACAAPGTKSQQMAILMANQGEIIACDIYDHRLKIMQEMLDQTATKCISLRKHDATIIKPEWFLAFDRILLDVPCTGLGDLAHKPEIRFHIKPEKIDELQKIQRRILDVNARYLKKDAYLIYSTCTLNKKENEQQIHEFIKRTPTFQLLAEETFFPQDGCDGFYYAKLRRISEEDMVE